MKKYFLFFLFLFFVPISVFADSAKSSIVMDIDTGRILYSKDPDSKRLIASTTKIMTAIVVLENSKLDKVIEVGDEVEKMYGTNIYLEVGEELTVCDLLYGLLLRSGNDAAITLATNTLGYDSFIEKMNEKANEIGMVNTTFSNPHGLDDNTKNYSTAYDMALLARYAFNNSFYRKIVSTKKYLTKSNLKSYSWYNRMSLLSQYSYCVGGKNGYTPSAGKTLVSYAKKNGTTLLIVSLNDSDIYVNHKNLYEKYFKDYSRYTVVSKDDFINNQDLYLKESFYYSLYKDEIDSIYTLVQLFPVHKDSINGYVTIYFKKEEIGKIPIYKKIVKKKKDNNIFQKILNLVI